MNNSKKKPIRSKSARYRGANEFELVRIEPMTDRQAKVLRSKKHLVLSGYAGTGKTFLTSFLALDSIFKGEYSRLVYIRSAVPSRDIGFLPGTDKEKLEVYEAPYIDIASELLGRGDAYSILKSKGLINFMSTSFIRGTTLRDAVIIVDETQNMTYQELDTVITRVGPNCRIMFCGDIKQNDLFHKSGFNDFYKVIQSMDKFDFVDFLKEDIVRDELVKDYIIKKDEILNQR
jgi:phosphate starvation-inducible PhoH-like protein